MMAAVRCHVHYFERSKGKRTHFVPVEQKKSERGPKCLFYLPLGRSERKNAAGEKIENGTVRPLFMVPRLFFLDFAKV